MSTRVYTNNQLLNKHFKGDNGRNASLNLFFKKIFAMISSHRVKKTVLISYGFYTVMATHLQLLQNLCGI